MANNGTFGVFCERAYSRDREPISRHRTLENAKKRAEKEKKQFFSQSWNSNAMISYRVYEEVDKGVWLEVLED
jgi:hypothetical protein